MLSLKDLLDEEPDDKVSAEIKVSSMEARPAIRSASSVAEAKSPK